MSTLHVTVDQLVAPVPGGVGRWTAELTRALVDTAPAGHRVVGIAPRLTPQERTAIHQAIPGLAGLDAGVLDRRFRSLAWQYGVVGSAARGVVHANSPFAPLHPHAFLHDGQQIAVTIYDSVPWTHPETLTRRGVSWHRAMGRRAERYADAIVVPTHAVADELAGILAIGDRIRVIGGAVSSTLQLPQDPDAHDSALGLPARYILAVGTLEPRKGLDALLAAMPLLPDDVDLVVIGPEGWGSVSLADEAAKLGLSDTRVRRLGRVSDEDLAVALSRAAVFVQPSRAEGFGLPILEAFTFGTPVVHSDAPALSEVAGGAGVEVALAPADSYPARLAKAIRGVLDDRKLASRLSLEGRDRASAFSWRDSAEKVWELHAPFL